MSGHTCDCGQPAPTTTICGGCRDRLARDLGDVPAYAAELDTTLTRQRAVTYSGSRSSETALPFNWRASEAGWLLRSTLVGWVRELAPDDHAWPAGTVDAMSRWLLARVDDLASHPAGDEAATEIATAMTEVRLAVDNPPERLYAGPCGQPRTADGSDWCNTDLYATPGRTAVTCPSCAATHAVADRRTWLLEQLEDVLASATEIARGVSRLGEPVSASTIRSWARRSRLQAKGLNLRGDPLYRVGDVLDLYAGVSVSLDA